MSETFVTIQQRPASEELNYLTDRLSDELLLHIFRHIQTHDDFARLSETCRRLNELLKDKDFCSKVCLPWYSQLSRISVTRFLKDTVRVAVINQLDFSDLYWVPSGIIRDLVVPMVNLETLLTAGTSLSWTHLSQLLKSISCKKLSWSWDNALEESCRRRSSISPTKFFELTELEDAFLKLNSLLLHIPMMAKIPTDVLFYSYTALEYLVSLCQNLENLWFLSWPKTSAERKSSSSSYNRRDFDNFGSAFTKLHTLVISVKGPPRFSPMSFFRKLVNTFGVVTPAKVFWCDHPLLGILNNEEQFRLGQARHCWTPQMCSEEAVRLSYPLVAVMEAARENFCYPKLKHVLLCQSQPVVVNLNGFFDNSPDLESFYCSTFNLRVDWHLFVESHPKLKAISVSEDEGMGEHSVAFSKLEGLEKLSLSMDCLLEIRDTFLIAEYATVQDIDTEIEVDSRDEFIKDSEILFKKRRVGTTPSNSASSTDAVTGLHFIALRCSKLNEIELGYTGSSQAKAGRFAPDGLLSISRFKFLKKLSLSSLPISNGNFLTAIFSSCDIESLRLTHLGPSAKCCYIQDLCQALKFGRKLKDFRLEQNYIGSPKPILAALKNCSNIYRVLIWSSPNDKALEFDHVDELFKSCPNLSVFYATVECTTKSDCFRIRKALEAKYKAGRPALSIVLRRTLEAEELIYYPSIHYRQMVVNQTQVCQFNDFQNF